MFCRANPSILFFFFKNDLAIVGSLYFHQNFKKLNVIPTLSLSPHHLTESAVTKVSEALPIVKSTGQFLVFILFDLFTALAITVYCFLHETLSSLSFYNITLLGFFYTHCLGFSPTSLAAPFSFLCWILLFSPTAKCWKSNHNIPNQPRAQSLNLFLFFLSILSLYG